MTTPSRWQIPFFSLWSAQAASLFGSALVQFALIWWLTTTSGGSATVLATASLLGLLPNVFLVPIAGVVADRWNRRRVMLLADSAVALATLALAGLFAAGVVQIWHVYLILFIRSAAGAFHYPAMQATTTLMVPEVHLTRVGGLNQMLQGLNAIAAPPLGALLLAWLPLQGILAIDVVTALIGIAPLFFLAIPEPPRSGVRSTFLEDMAAGWRYVWAWPGLVGILLLALVINFLINPGMSLLPILVTNHFHGQALQLAALDSALGVGMIFGGLTLSVWGGFKRRIYTSLAGLALLGACLGLLGIAPASGYPLAVAALALMGFTLPIVNGPIMAVMQVVVRPEMQGRVFTLIGAIAAAMSPLGLMLAGPLADRVGVQAWYLAACIACILSGAVGYSIPAIRSLEDHKDPGPEPVRAEAEGAVLAL